MITAGEVANLPFAPDGVKPGDAIKLSPRAGTKFTFTRAREIDNIFETKVMQMSRCS